MLYALVLLSLAGVVTGSLFRVQSLVLLLAIALIEFIALPFAGIPIDGTWIVINITAIQLGYLAGLSARWSFEQAGYSIPSGKIRWP